jgi:CheY-like chemotaxis protein
MFHRWLNISCPARAALVVVGLCIAIQSPAKATVVLQSGSAGVEATGSGGAPQERIRPSRNETVSRGVHWSWVVLAAMIGFAPLAIERIYRKSVSRHRYTRMGVTMLETELEELKAQNRRLQAILDALNTMPDGMEINDDEGRQIYSNAKYRELFSAPADLNFDGTRPSGSTVPAGSGNQNISDGHVDDEVPLPDGRKVAIKRLRSASGGSVILYTDAGEHSSVRPEASDQSDFELVRGRPVSDAGGNREKLRILLAEDNEAYQKTLQGFLTAAGHTVNTVENGETVIAEVRRNAYDVLLIDFQMLGMDGVTTAQAIRALDGEVAKIPIIALTADATFADDDRYRSMGANGFVAKPIEPLELFGALGKIHAAHAAPISG